MKFLRKLKDSAKGVPLLVWALGVVVPFGLTMIALYIAYRTAKQNDKPSEETKND